MEYHGFTVKMCCQFVYLLQDDKVSSCAGQNSFDTVSQYVAICSSHLEKYLNCVWSSCIVLISWSKYVSKSVRIAF